MMDVSCLELPECAPVRGLLSLKETAKERLRAVVAGHDAAEKEGLKKCPSLWEIAEVAMTSITEVLDDAKQEEKQEQREKCVVKRLHIDWVKNSGGAGQKLYEEASRMLRRVKGMHAKVLMKTVEVPNVLDGDWTRPFLDESFRDGGVRQLLLPYDIVQRDDDRMTHAPDKIVCMARENLQRFQHADVSLTTVSMKIPSLWNCETVVDSLTNIVAESLNEKEANDLPTSSSGPATQNLPDSCSTNQLEKSPSSPPPKQMDEESKRVSKLAVLEDENSLSTEYFLSDAFLGCKWSEPSQRPGTDKDHDIDDASIVQELPRFDQLLHQIARPALWDLARKKLLQVDQASFQDALNRVSLETLEAIVYQQFLQVKTMSLNPSSASNSEIMEACISLRQAAWLHTLRLISICKKDAEGTTPNMVSAILARILSSVKYNLVLGASNWRDLQKLIEALAASVPLPLSTIATSCDESTNKKSESPDFTPAMKKIKIGQAGQGEIPVRVMCSIQFLSHHDLLDELCTEHVVYFIERDLPMPIDILVDERNCICVLSGGVFDVEENMRNVVFSLARVQAQFKKCWIIIAVDATPTSTMEEVMRLFFAALVQIRIETQTFISTSFEESGRLIRAIIDECGDVALSQYRILPRMWFERPFLLEEESQFERFLVSTKIVNHFSAQSLLHRISLDDLFTTSMEELKPIIQNALTDEQLQLLWRLLHTNHGLSIDAA